MRCVVGAITMNMFFRAFSAEVRIWLLRFFEEVVPGQKYGPLQNSLGRRLRRYYTRKILLHKDLPVLEPVQESPDGPPPAITIIP
jgi:hypothetical protein